MLTAFAVATTGTRISAIALPWFVLVTTGSAAQTGLIAACELAPYVAAKALGGPLVDRLGPRVVSWTTDLVSAAAAALVPLLHAAGALPLWQLALLVAVIGAVRGPGDLAKQVMVPEAAEAAGVPLERATGLVGVVERLAATIGPAAGGALVAVAGAMTGLVVTAACFALGSVVLLATLPPGAGRPTRHADEPEGYWAQFAAGLRFLRTDRLLLTVTLMIAVTNLLDAAYLTVVVPVWAHETGRGASAVGLADGVWGAAAMAGSLVAAAVAHRLPRRAVFFGGFLLAGAPRFLLLALDVSGDVPMGLILAVLAVSGFGGGFLNPILGAVVVERIPRPMLGRVQGLGSALAWSGMPLGGVAAGAAIAALGLTPAFLLAAAAYFLATSAPALHPVFRQLDRRPGEKAAP
jgi:MFS family permease